MGVQEVWICRHGFREDWINKNPPLPTGIKTDPTLSEEGIGQAQEVANFLKNKPIDRIYASPSYRVLQTVYPLVEASDIPLYIDYLMAEWPDLIHPEYASLSVLKSFFPKLDINHHTSTVPFAAEKITDQQIHMRVKKGMDILIHHLDAETNPPHTILLAGHAATVICAARALTDNTQLDVRCGLCSLSRLLRQPDGSWQLIENGHCDHLSQGEQKSWCFPHIIPDYDIMKK